MKYLRWYLMAIWGFVIAFVFFVAILRILVATTDGEASIISLWVFIFFIVHFCLAVAVMYKS